jgi:hypothetical protein
MRRVYQSIQYSISYSSFTNDLMPDRYRDLRADNK